MRLEPDGMAPVLHRIKIAQGQLAAVRRLLEEGRDCEDVVTAARGSVQGVGPCGLRHRREWTPAVPHRGRGRRQRRRAEDGEALPLPRLKAAGPAPPAHADGVFLWSASE